MAPRTDDRTWRPERAKSVADLIGEWLNHLARVYDAGPEAFLPPDPLPLPTGVEAIDRLVGGVRLGALTVIEADEAGQAQALSCTVARRIKHPMLLAVKWFGTVTWLLAGAAQVPAVCIYNGALSEADWDAITRVIGELAAQDLWLTDAASLGGLAHVVRQRAPRVLVVEDIDRFGEPIRVVPWLARLAEMTGVAILATAEPLGDVAEWALEGVTRLRMASHCLGGRAALVHSDDITPLAVQQVHVEMLTAELR